MRNIDICLSSLEYDNPEDEIHAVIDEDSVVIQRDGEYVLTLTHGTALSLGKWLCHMLDDKVLPDALI